MIITLSNKKQIEVLGTNLRNSTVDFKWIDGVYGGECNFPIVLEEGTLPTIEEVEAAANAGLVTDVL